MTRLVHSEFIKLRTLRSTYAVGAALLALVGIIVAAALGDAGSEGMTTPAQLREPVIVAAGLMTAIFVAVLGATTTASEYRHDTIAQRFLASPARSRVLLAKLVTIATIGGLLAALMVAVGLAIAQPMVAAKHLSLALSAGDAVQLLAGVIVAGAAFGMLGVLVGAATRSQSTAVIAIFGLLLAEKLSASLTGAAGAYLPFGLLDAVTGLEHTPARGVAALALVAITVAASIAVGTLLIRRDVT
jgi:ABC-2 type transport system permease protein